MTKATHFCGKYSRGSSIMDIITTVAVFTTIVLLAVPAGISLFNQLKYSTAIDEITIIAEAVSAYCDQQGCPDKLNQVFGEEKLDPWGKPYQYLKIAGVHPSPLSQSRKQRTLNLINTRFDLYSMGPDGISTPILSDASSRDDIIYANDGKYIGYVDEYID